MDKFLITGPCQIKGKVTIAPSKNAAIPILAATLLFDKPVVISNLPKVRDVDTMISLLRSLGSKIILSKDSRTAKIINQKKMNTVAKYSIVKKMRGSFLVLGPLIAKQNNAKCSLPGGCSFGGTRPVNYHLEGLKKLGMNFRLKDGYILAKSKGKLKGTSFKFPKITVGGSQNLIIAACLARGTTTLRNVCLEPETKDLTKFLNSAGAKIKWSGRTCTIEGVNSLNQTEYSIMPDRIMAGTFCIAACLNKGELEIDNINSEIINAELNLLKKVGAYIKTSDNKIFIKGPKKIKRIKNIVTKEYPGVATDLQSQLMVLMCKANGKSIITENIFSNRFSHAAELRRLGGKINIINNKAFIEGVKKLVAAPLISSDLRGSIALVLAATVAEGTSKVDRVYHAYRGAENFVNKLKKIGVKIKVLKK